MADKDIEALNARLDRMERLMFIGQKDVLTMAECSIYTGLSESTLYKKTMAKEIPFYKPRQGYIYFKKSEINDWLLQNRQATKEEIESMATTYCVTHKTGSRKPRTPRTPRTRAVAN